MAQSVERLNKRCILKLTKDASHFIVANLNGDSNVQVWGQIDNETVFEDIRVESLNNNEIWLEISTDALCKALKSTQSALEATCKLTKKDDVPTLSFSITQAPKGAGSRFQVTQDVAVQVLTAQQADDYKEPLVPEPQVHIVMPPLTDLRVIVERFKALHNQVSVAGNMDGSLRLLVESDIVHVETMYSGLLNPSLDPSQINISQQQASANRDPVEFARCVVDTKDFAKFVGSHIVNPSSVVCCIIENHALVFYVYVGAPGAGDSDQHFGALTYYIPAKTLNP